MSTRTGWKAAVVVTLSLAVLGLATCGGSSRPSGLAKRAFVSDDYDGTLHIEDALRDEESGHTIATGAQPGVIRLSPDKTLTLVFNAGSGTLSVVMNSTEIVLGSIALPGTSTDYVIMSNDTVGFAAVPSSGVTPCIPRCVEVVNLATTNAATTFQITGTINADTTGAPLNAASTLVLSPSGSKLLVFAGPGEHVDTLTVVDTATAQTTPASAATQLSGFDRPVSAVFSGDSTKAYVLNCGPECGGTAASVTVLDMTASPPAPLANIPVPAASIGLVSGTTLFVAGTPSGTPGAFAGQLSALNTNALATPTSTIPISDGYHNLIQLASNNTLFIGAVNCSAGCLTMFPSTGNPNAAVVDSNTGNVTGIAPINGRTVVYVVEDLLAGVTPCSTLPCPGKLRIYDTTTDALTPPSDQIDIVGKCVDVKYVDQ